MTRSSGEPRPFNWNGWIRQFHRWIAIAFTLTVAANFALMPFGEPPFWIYMLPLLPLFLLLFTGLYLFALPYIARWQRGRRPVGQE